MYKTWWFLKSLKGCCGISMMLQKPQRCAASWLCSLTHPLPHAVSFLTSPTTYLRMVLPVVDWALLQYSRPHLYRRAHGQSGLGNFSVAVPFILGCMELTIKSTEECHLCVRNLYSKFGIPDPHLAGGFTQTPENGALSPSRVLKLPSNPHITQIHARMHTHTQFCGSHPHICNHCMAWTSCGTPNSRDCL